MLYKLKIIILGIIGFLLSAGLLATGGSLDMYSHSPHQLTFHWFSAFWAASCIGMLWPGLLYLLRVREIDDPHQRGIDSLAPNVPDGMPIFNISNLVS